MSHKRASGIVAFIDNQTKHNLCKLKVVCGQNKS
jgi:hypothetical protein